MKGCQLLRGTGILMHICKMQHISQIMVKVMNLIHKHV